MNRFEAIVEVVRLVPANQRAKISILAVILMGTPILGAIATVAAIIR